MASKLSYSPTTRCILRVRGRDRDHQKAPADWSLESSSQEPESLDLQSFKRDHLVLVTLCVFWH